MQLHELIPVVGTEVVNQNAQLELAYATHAVLVVSLTDVQPSSLWKLHKTCEDDGNWPVVSPSMNPANLQPCTVVALTTNVLHKNKP